MYARLLADLHPGRDPHGLDRGRLRRRSATGSPACGRPAATRRCARCSSTASSAAWAACIVFLPNIVLLFLGLALLEDTGYMARAAFLMDRLMHRFGLHGKSFMPLMTGFGCSIPGIMATRTLENERDRLITMLVLPLMSCGARLPIWMLLDPGLLRARLAGADAVGHLRHRDRAGPAARAAAAPDAVRAASEAPFVMELPPYRLPTLRGVVTKMLERGLAVPAQGRHGHPGHLDPDVVRSPPTRSRTAPRSTRPSAAGEVALVDRERDRRLADQAGVALITASRPSRGQPRPCVLRRRPHRRRLEPVLAPLGLRLEDRHRRWSAPSPPRRSSSPRWASSTPWARPTRSPRACATPGPRLLTAGGHLADAVPAHRHALHGHRGHHPARVGSWKWRRFSSAG